MENERVNPSKPRARTRKDPPAAPRAARRSTTVFCGGCGWYSDGTPDDQDAIAAWNAHIDNGHADRPTRAPRTAARGR